MKKVFLMLCLSALVFTGCKKKSSPGGSGGSGSEEAYSSESGRAFIAYCKENLQINFCASLLATTEMSPQEAKPVMKLEKNSTEMLYGASNPSAWEEGYSNLPIVDENGGDITYTSNFSVESGSVLATGMEYKFGGLSSDNTKLVGQPREFVPGEVGGDSFVKFGNTYKGKKYIRVAIFPDLKKYLFLPPLRFAP